MASKISELTAVTVPADTDEFAVNQGGTSKKVTRAQIRSGLATVAQLNDVAAITVDQNDIVARIAAGSGPATGLASGDLTEEETPATGDFLLGWESGGGLRKFDIGDLPSTAGTQLSDLTDVGDTTPTNRNVLVADGDSWEARALTTADIQSGVFVDARIAGSNVTQHVAAIDHDALLNFVANEHIDHSAVQVSAGTGLQGGGAITSTVTLDLADTAVTPDEYTIATITVDQQGRITAASSGSGTDASGSRVETTTGALTVETADHEVTKGITLTTDQASAVFTIANDIAAGKIFKFNPLHDGATIVVEGDAGSIDGESGGTANLINGGVALLEVISNAGTAPVCVTYGDVIHAPTSINSTKTYDVNDSGQEFALVSGAGTQTMPATAGIPAGWEVAIYNESGGSITVAGADASITLEDGDMCAVKKAVTELRGFGTYDAGKTLLDAA